MRLWAACTLLGILTYVWSAEMLPYISADDGVRRSFGGLLAQVVGGFAGFMLATLALAFTLPDRPMMQAMHASGHFLDLCASLFSATLACLVVTAFSAVLSVAANVELWTELVLSSIPAAGIMLFYAGIRFVLTLLVVARPD